MTKEKVKDKNSVEKKQEEIELTQEERINALSQKIFGKPAKDLKYLLVTNYIHQQLLEEELARTGLYQWVNVFKGEVKYPRDVIDYNEYDIIQINMSSQDTYLVSEIRSKLKTDGKTKLVVNNDYTTELWGTSFQHPTALAKELNEADLLFGTEYYQTTTLSELTGRRCYVIPHPADVKRLKNLPKRPVKEIISTIWRRYDNFSYVPSLAVRNHGLTTQLIGFDKSVDKRVWLTTTLYDWVFSGTNYFDYCDQMRESKVVYDPFTFHSYNRGVVDCAAMGVPVVGSDRTQSVNVCYPFTKVDPYDTLSARKMIERLLTDDAFREKVIKHAQEAVEIYNYENSMEKYLTALDEALALGRVVEREVKEREIIDRGVGEDVNTLMAKSITRKNDEKNKTK